MEVFVFWLIFSFVAAIIASNKGRSGFGFFLLSVILSPLVGVIGALIARPAEKIEMEKARHGDSDEYKKCPMCAEVVRKEAIKCRYCGADLTEKKAPAEAYTGYKREPGTVTVLDEIARNLGTAVGKAMHSNASARREKTLEEILAEEQQQEAKK